MDVGLCTSQGMAGYWGFSEEVAFKLKRAQVLHAERPRVGRGAQKGPAELPGLKVQRELRINWGTVNSTTKCQA